MVRSIETRLQQESSDGPNRAAAGGGTDAPPDRVWGERLKVWQMELHGHRVIYRTAGSGPPLVLIHGMVNSSRHWEQVAMRLAADHLVVAPDLIGHGDSATPRGDYSMGAHAAVIRDMLAVLGIERATIAGHSLGGGVAMEFFYQFPHRVQRLVLLSSGGLGREVSPLLRAAAVPGAAGLLALGTHPAVSSALWRAGERLRAGGVDGGVHLQAISRALQPLQRRGARQAFLHTLRSVIDVRGQRVSATDRLYLLEGTPTLIVWGERDRTIPIAHGEATHAAVPHSRFVTLPAAAHFPHLEDPDAVAGALREFIADTAPGRTDDADWAGMIAPRSHRGAIQ